MTIILDGTNGITTPKDVEIQGTTSGSIVIAAPAVAGSNTQTLVAVTGTLAPIVSGTAVASTSGTSIDFTGIPSWAKRVTVMFNGVSTNGTSGYLIQIGAGSVTSSGYVSVGINANSTNSTGGISSTAGFCISSSAAADIFSGSMTILNFSGNSWVANHTLKRSSTAASWGGGDVALSGVLDRVRITTVNGTDTFDAGSINILWE